MNRMTTAVLALVAGAALPGAAQVRLNGAGATFPNIIYQNWILTYNQSHPDVKLNYQSIGSGGGIRQFSDGTVDFGGTDAPMSDSAIAAISGNVLHIPTVLGAVVPAYNLPDVKAELKFSGESLAGIFLGKITKWNAAEIAKDNPGVKLPDKPILVVHRAEGSGTTYIFTDYLSKISPEWQQKVGKGTAVQWPTGLGQQGNEAVAGMVRQTEGAIGYVELIYALKNKIPYGSVKNVAGQYVKASLESTTAAAASMKEMPEDFRVSITNAPGKTAYPIASFTWLLVPVKWDDATKQKAMVSFLNWMLNSGEGMVSSLDYAPLPKAVADKVRTKIKTIQ